MFLLTMLSIVSFTGCDKTDEHNGPGTDYDNLFDKTYEEFYKLKYCSTVVYMVPRA